MTLRTSPPSYFFFLSTFVACPAPQVYVHRHRLFLSPFSSDRAACSLVFRLLFFTDRHLRSPTHFHVFVNTKEKQKTLLTLVNRSLSHQPFFCLQTGKEGKPLNHGGLWIDPSCVSLSLSIDRPFTEDKKSQYRRTKTKKEDPRGGALASIPLRTLERPSTRLVAQPHCESLRLPLHTHLVSLKSTKQFSMGGAKTSMRKQDERD